MSRRFVSLMTLTLMLIGMFGVALRAQRTKAGGTIYIRADGSVEPDTAPISSDDNITYTFTDNINDSIVVEKDNIVVDGADHTLRGAGAYLTKGIFLSGRSNVTIKDIEINAFYYGIHLEHSFNNTVSGNHITNNEWYGVELSRSSHNSISGNHINNEWCAIELSRSSHNSISGNHITNNLVGIWVLYCSNYTRISGNNITNNTYSISLYYCSNYTRISGNNITNNTNGIRLHSSSNYNIVSGNTITGNNGSGIRLYESSNYNIVSGNTITGNNGTGIDLSWSSNYTTISGNYITNNENGILLFRSSNTTISGNYITNNENAMQLFYSPNNSVYHNNFIENAQQIDVWLADIFPSVNTWDNGYPSGGNYWSNYTNVDLLGSPHQNETGSDGIGDDRYTIDANNTDNYPLMGMFSDFNATSEHNVQTICNSSISDFQYNGTAICFNVTSENGTTAFCRICIPRALMNDTYQVFVNGTEVPHTLLPCSNTTNSYLHFTYNHSTQEVVIIPEFPTWTSMLSILMMIIVALAICKRRLPKTRSQ